MDIYCSYIYKTKRKIWNFAPQEFDEFVPNICGIYGAEFMFCFLTQRPMLDCGKYILFLIHNIEPYHLISFLICNTKLLHADNLI